MKVWQRERLSLPRLRKLHNRHSSSKVPSGLLELLCSLSRKWKVFGEQAENRDVYDGVAAGLVESARLGGVSTMFMFGQTGSGKTHTMSAIQDYVAPSIARVKHAIADAHCSRISPAFD
eukprot:6233828-Amphidinium_carterae.1